MLTNKTFEDVEQKVQEGFIVYRAYNEKDANGPYVELRGDGSRVDGTGVRSLEFWMDSVEEVEKVREKYK